MNEETRQKLIDKLEQQRGQARGIKRHAILNGNIRQANYARGLLSACWSALITLSEPPSYQTGYFEILEITAKILDDSRQ